MKRVLTALVLVPVLIAIIGYAPPLWFLLLVCGASILALEEYFSLATQAGLEVFRVPGHGSSLLLLSSLYGSATNATNSWTALLVLVASLLLFFTLGLRRGNRLPTVLPGVAGTLLGLLYVSLTLGLLVVVQCIADVLGSGKTVGFLSSNRGLVRGHGCLLYRSGLGEESSGTTYQSKEDHRRSTGRIIRKRLGGRSGQADFAARCAVTPALGFSGGARRREPDWRPFRIGTETGCRG